MRWLVNVAYQVDCLIGVVLTGIRNKTISAWLGQGRLGHFGPVWQAVDTPLAWLVDRAAWLIAREPDHCAAAAISCLTVANQE